MREGTPLTVYIVTISPISALNCVANFVPITIPNIPFSCSERSNSPKSTY